MVVIVAQRIPFAVLRFQVFFAKVQKTVALGAAVVMTPFAVQCVQLVVFGYRALEFGFGDVNTSGLV